LLSSKVSTIVPTTQHKSILFQNKVTFQLRHRLYLDKLALIRTQNKKAKQTKLLVLTRRFKERICFKGTQIKNDQGICTFMCKTFA
ncbi:hypothetical protein VIGAN_02131600, partial [Vigna angularis var. angularis]